MSHRAFSPSGSHAAGSSASFGSAYANPAVASIPSIKSHSQAPFSSAFGSLSSASSSNGSMQFGALPASDSNSWGSQVLGSLNSGFAPGSNAYGALPGSSAYASGPPHVSTSSRPITMNDVSSMPLYYAPSMPSGSEGNSSASSPSWSQLSAPQEDASVQLPLNSALKQSDRMARISTGAALGRTNAAGSSAVTISPAVAPRSGTLSSQSPSSGSAPSTRFVPQSSALSPFQPSGLFQPPPQNSGMLPGFPSVSAHDPSPSGLSPHGIVFVPARADAPLPDMSRQNFTLLPSKAVPIRPSAPELGDQLQNLQILPPSSAVAAASAKPPTEVLLRAAQNPSPVAVAPASVASAQVAPKIEPPPSSVQKPQVQPVQPASAKVVGGALPAFPSSSDVSAAPISLAPVPAEAFPPLVAPVAASSSAAPAAPKWTLDITEIPLSPADANRSLVFVGCPGKLTESSVMKDLQAIGANLPAAQMGEATWSRGSFVMSFQHRKHAISFHKRLHNTKVSGTQNMKYFCEIHNPPHTAIAKIFRDAGKPNPLDRKAVANPSAAPSAPAPIYEAVASSSAKAPVSAPAQAAARLPSFGGPAAPASASPYASPAAAAAKKKIPAPVPAAVPAAKPTAAAAKKVPASPANKPAQPSSSGSFTIGGVVFEEITQSEWNPFYQTQNMLVDRKDLECQICLEEISKGQVLATLFCLCQYHQRCIDDWFNTCVHVKHKKYPECPTHQDFIEQNISMGTITLH